MTTSTNGGRCGRLSMGAAFSVALPGAMIVACGTMISGAAWAGDPDSLQGPRGGPRAHGYGYGYGLGSPGRLSGLIADTPGRMVPRFSGEEDLRLIRGPGRLRVEDEASERSVRLHTGSVATGSDWNGNANGEGHGHGDRGTDGGAMTSLSLRPSAGSRQSMVDAELRALSEARKAQDVAPLLTQVWEAIAHAPDSVGGGSPPLQATLGRVVLLPNTAGQMLTIEVQNVSGSAVSIAGLNFSFQIGDTGPESEGGFGLIDGPNIQSVELGGAGTVFGSNNTGTTAGGGPPQAGSWNVTTSSGNVSLAAGASTALALVLVDTTGLETGEWPIILSLNVPALGIAVSSAYVGSDGSDILIGSTEGLIAVPEPGTMSLAVGVLLGGFLGYRRMRGAPRVPAAESRGCGVV